ncbi:MAG TPA: hypothetical protein VMK32_05015 [Burkholderiaceae bacterium]|nr:hypothetical protein [Burkholderiaceae bacterium]
MHLTVLLTGSQLPAALAASLVTQLDAPELARLLARGRRIEQNVGTRGSATEDWLARNVFGTDAPPTAPYAWADLTGERVTVQTLWHAEAVHIGVGRDSLFVESLADDPPTDAEADALIAAANDCLGEAATLVHVGARWFLRTHETWRIRASALPAAAARPLLATGMEDEEEMRWNRLHNAVQMAWHAHPVNAARESQSRRTVGGLWLHGGGKWAARAPLRWAGVHSERPELRGVAAAAGSIARAASAAVSDSDALLVWDDAAEARRREDWPAWLGAMNAVDRRLAEFPSTQLTLILAGETSTQTWQVRDTDRLRFWRHHDLGSILGEATP